MSKATEQVAKLREESRYKDKATLEIMDLCMGAAETIERLESENAALHERLAEKDKQIKQWEDALSAFDDGVAPTRDAMDFLADPDNLKKWIARAAWHCRKVSEMNEDIEGLNAAVERRDNMLAEQSKALSDLQGRFDIINNFEQSQCVKLLGKIAEMDKSLARVTAERDAAIKYIPHDCETCKHWRPRTATPCIEPSRTPCEWRKRQAWEWCGPKKEDVGNDDK